MSQEQPHDSIVDLEARVAFQEDTIDKLNTQVAEQGLQLDELRKQMQVLYQKMSNLMYEWEQSGGGERQEKPPHY